MTFATVDLELLREPDQAAGEHLLPWGPDDLKHVCPRCETPKGKACKLDSGLYVTGQVHGERRYEHDIGF